MQIDLPGIMTPFSKLPHGELFLTFLDKTMKVFGMRIKLGRDSAVLHLNGGAPKVVSETHFINKDVLSLREISFRFPDMSTAQGGSPDTFAYGSAIVSAQGTLIRSAHANGPFDVEIGNGIAEATRSHPGSLWFDSWSVILERPGTPEILFSQDSDKPNRK